MYKIMTAPIPSVGADGEQSKGYETNKIIPNAPSDSNRKKESSDTISMTELFDTTYQRKAMPQPLIEDAYYVGSEAEQYVFYRFPKALITNEYYAGVSDSAKILYGLMLDRMGLSIRNGWLDANERVYLFHAGRHLRSHALWSQQGRENHVRAGEHRPDCAGEARTG